MRHDFLPADGNAVHIRISRDDRLSLFRHGNRRILPAFAQKIAVRHIARNRLPDSLRRLVRQFPIHRKLLEMPTRHLLRPRPLQNLRDNPRAETPADRVRRAENERRLIRDASADRRRLTVSAMPARPLRLLPEIIQQEIPKTPRRPAIILHPPQPLIIQIRLLPIRFILRNQILLDPDIARTVEQNAIRRRPVTPRAPRLLVIRLRTLGHRVMDDIAHIAFVDAHTESIRRDHHRRPIEREILLRLASFLIRHPRMIAPDRHAETVQKRIRFLHRLSRRAINNPRLFRMRLDVLANEILFVDPAHHTKRQIRPIQPRPKEPRTEQIQILPHIPLDQRRRRRRESRHHRPHRKFPDKFIDFPIARPEIMPPLRDAMRLIDHDQRERHLPETIREISLLQFLRRHIQKLQPPAIQIPQPLDCFLLRDRTIHKSRRNPLRRKRLHLILHERNQRRNHHRPMRQSQRRDLETDGLPRARRHDRHHIVPTQNRPRDLLLHGAKRIVSEIPLQKRLQIHTSNLSENFLPL